MEVHYIWLECIKGLGPLAWHHLLKEYGNPEEIYRNRFSLVPAGKVTGHQLELIKSGSEEAMEKAKIIQESCNHFGVRIIKYDDLEYAENIKQYMDFPVLFYTKGHIRNNWTHGCGIIGARRCSAEGKAYAVKTAAQLVDKGCAVISGLAKGIDSYAHTAALNHAGYTVAVLGYGIDQCYPVEHKKLKEKIEQEGLLISEYPPGTPPRKFYFPKRNRIIAGLSETLYVIDTGKNSGTKTTIQAAERYGKTIRKFGDFETGVC